MCKKVTQHPPYLSLVPNSVDVLLLILIPLHFSYAPLENKGLRIIPSYTPAFATLELGVLE